jgi:twitching motility two-component system response regulator PilG
MEQKIPLLCQTQIDLSFAASGEEAMKKVKQESPDLIFLDVMMPDVDGYKVCKWIKSIQPTAHVAMLTSKKSPFDKVRGAMSGCNDYLTKPPEDSTLAKILQEN